MDRCKDVPMRKFDDEAIKSIAAGILSTARAGKLDIFPCTSEFLLELAEKTKRQGEFNVREFIRSLIGILEVSLEWERSAVELTKDFVELDQTKLIIAHVAEEEEKRAELIKPPEEVEE